MQQGTQSAVRPRLADAAQVKLEEVIRKNLMAEDILEPVVLQQLASYPEEVQKNVIERFISTGLEPSVQNKTGWLVGILKRELKAYQEAVRFRGLDPAASRKLENALRTRRLRPEEFPSDVIGVLSKCDVAQQGQVVDKFLQKHGQQALNSQTQGSTMKQRTPYVTARNHLLEILKSEIGSHVLHGLHTENISSSNVQSQSSSQHNNTRKRKDGENLRAILSQHLHALNEETINFLLSQADADLCERLMEIQGSPNFIDPTKLWNIIGAQAKDEQQTILREIMVLHSDILHKGPYHSETIAKEEFRKGVENVMWNFGFHGYRDSEPPLELKARISLGRDGVTELDLSNLPYSYEQWRKELSPPLKRKLRDFMKEVSNPSLRINLENSRVTENIGFLLAEFFTEHKPDLGPVSLASLRLKNTDLQSDRGWSLVALFLLNCPVRDLEITPSKISGLSLGVLVHTMFDGEFPSYAPFYQTQGEDGKAHHHLALPNQTSIKFPVTREPWVLNWISAGQMLVDSETLVNVHYHYQQLRSRRQNPSLWWEPQGSSPPIHPARMALLYSKLGNQKYLDPGLAKEQRQDTGSPPPQPGNYNNYYGGGHQVPEQKGGGKGALVPAAPYYDYGAQASGYDYYWQEPQQQQQAQAWRNQPQRQNPMPPPQVRPQRGSSPQQNYQNQPQSPQSPPVPPQATSTFGPTGQKDTVVVDFRGETAAKEAPDSAAQSPSSTSKQKKHNKIPKNAIFTPLPPLLGSPAVNPNGIVGKGTAAGSKSVPKAGGQSKVTVLAAQKNPDMPSSPQMGGQSLHETASSAFGRGGSDSQSTN